MNLKLIRESDMGDFIVPDDEDLEVSIRKPKKKATDAALASSGKSTSTSRFAFASNSNADGSTIPLKASSRVKPNPVTASIASSKGFGKGKEEIRHPWLANVRDADGNLPDHQDYDPRTLYIPPFAWSKFSPFEKQYWEIKCKNYDTIVFFRKGKFYEIFENDASQLPKFLSGGVQKKVSN